MDLTFGKNGVIEMLSVDGRNIIEPWSIEAGDTASFFSLEQPGWRVSRQVNNLYIDSVSMTGDMDVVMTDGLFNLKYDSILEGNNLSRSATLLAKQDSLLMDFVQQYRFKREMFRYAIIDGKKFEYRNSNIYNQFAVSRVELYGDEFKLDVVLDEVKTNSNFEPVMYVRDYRDMWIVHCRLLPKVVNRTMIKLNVPWYNRAIPKTLSDRLLNIPQIKEYIWYRGERSPYPRWQLWARLLKPTGYNLAMLKEGEILALRSHVNVIN